jgi:hypothetical protein
MESDELILNVPISQTDLERMQGHTRNEVAIASNASRDDLRMTGNECSWDVLLRSILYYKHSTIYYKRQGDITSFLGSGERAIAE